jgi:hypothetical protein
LHSALKCIFQYKLVSSSLRIRTLGRTVPPLHNRNKPELLTIFFVTNFMVKRTEHCRLLKNLPKPKFYASNKRNMSGQKMTCGNSREVTFCVEGKPNCTGGAPDSSAPSQRWQKKWLTYIFALFAVTRDLESATHVSLFVRIRNTTEN